MYSNIGYTDRVTVLPATYSVLCAQSRNSTVNSKLQIINFNRKIILYICKVGKNNTEVFRNMDGR